MSTNLYIAFELTGIPDDADLGGLIATVDDVLRVEGLFIYFDDLYDMRVVRMRVVAGGRAIRGGTPRPMSYVGGFGTKTDLAARFPGMRATFSTLPADDLSKHERLVHYVANDLGNSIERARGEIDDDDLGPLMSAYTTLPCWEQRACMHHLTMDQHDAYLEVMHRDLLSAPIDRENTGLHYAQVDAACALGHVGDERLTEQYDLLERALAWLRSNEGTLPLDELSRARYVPTTGIETTLFGDPASRAVYADWLEQRGDPRAEYLRDPSPARRAALDLVLDPVWLQAVRL